MLTDLKKQPSVPELWGGIECTINRVGDDFFDQLSHADFYTQPHLEALSGLGLRKLRFPILWERHQEEPGNTINWEWTGTQLEWLRKENIEVIAGLVHHGSGPAFTNLLDDRFPELLAAYAREVATRFPHINYYTPVNEPLTTARFSALYGLWYPHKRDDHSFARALLHQLKGIVLSMKEIRKINPAAQLVQTEDLGKTYSTEPLRYQAKFENERRWLTYDILCGRLKPGHKLWKYFTVRAGIPVQDLQFFIDDPCPPQVFGFNHYITSERYLDHQYANYPRHARGGNKRHRYADVEAARVPLKEPTGLGVLLKEAWERYGQPIAITEVHLHCHREEQIRWFKYVYDTANALTQEGVNILAVTAWALYGSFGWNKLLTQPNGDYEPGVFDLRSGSVRTTALTSYLRSLSGRSDFSHTHYTESKGWWQRASRFVFHPAIRNIQFNSPFRNSRHPVLIIGKRGTLGRAFARLCEQRAIPYKVLGRTDCDISDTSAVQAALDHYKPWAVINAAGFVRVDDAEMEMEQCFRDNCTGPATLARQCSERSIRLVSFSSDLVFDGAKRSPYVESDPVNPLNVYGKSKADAENILQELDPNSLIIRTSAFFSPWDQYNFIHWVENSLSAGVSIQVASDEMISPTYVPDLVHTSLDLLIDGERGIWHLANSGALTWGQLAKTVAKKGRYRSSLVRLVPSSEMGHRAERPLYAVLGTERGILLPDLETAIERYFSEKHQFAELID